MKVFAELFSKRDPHPLFSKSDPRFLILAVGKHELDAVFLVDCGSASIVVDRNDVNIGIALLKGLHDALTADMVWQAAKGLCAHDIGNTLISKLEHFGGEKPALTHFCSESDISDRKSVV